MTRRRHRSRRALGRHAHLRQGRGRAALPVSVSLLAVLGMATAVTASFLRDPDRVLPGEGVTPQSLVTLRPAESETSPSPSASPTPAASPSPSASATVVAAGRAVVPSERRRAVKVRSVSAAGSAKAVAVAPDGSVATMSMTSADVVVYDAAGRRRASIAATVRPADFGYTQWESTLRGSPVDGAFSPDGSHLWLAHYAMSGPGFSRPGDDDCRSGKGLDTSFVTRVDTRTWRVDAVVAVGAVPKDVRLTPDGARVLVSNWCSGELTVIDAGSAALTTTIPLGSHPRGIAVTKDSRTAYVALTGSSDVAVVDLSSVSSSGAGPVRRWAGVGAGPRQVVLSPDGRRAFVTCLEAGTVAEVDTGTGRVVRSVRTGREPRTAVLSGDGTALFVVNYESSTITRVSTSTLAVVETLRTPRHTIALGYQARGGQLWVARPDGTVDVYADQVGG